MKARHPNAWRPDFRAKKILRFLTFLAKFMAFIFGKVRKILQDFSRSWKEIVKKNSDFLARIPKKIEDLRKRTKKNYEFFAKKFLRYLRLFAKIWAVIFGKPSDIFQDFVRSWKEIQENSRSSWQENQE